MRFIHFADLHLGVETYGRLDTATGLNSRFLDFLSALDRLTEYAVETNVDLVLFCGDAYKSREPSQTQQREFAKRIKRMSENNIPVLLLVGNHDLPNAIGRATTTEIFDTLAVDKVYVANKPDIFNVLTKNGPIQIAALPWLRRSALLSREEVKSLDLTQIKEKMEQVLTGIVQDHSLKIDKGRPAILAAHVSIAGAQLGSERSMSFGQEAGLLLSNIASPAFDYVALGHIHRQQVLSDNPPVVYSGSLERIDFGEEADEKGFYEIGIQTDNTGKRQVSYNFHKIEGRRFLTINVAVMQNDTNPTDAVIKAIAAQPVENAIVRLQISLPESAFTTLNDAEIRKALNSAHCFTIVKNTARETRLRLDKSTAADLTPLNALQAFLDTKKVPPDRAKVLMEYGEKIITQQ